LRVVSDLSAPVVPGAAVPAPVEPDPVVPDALPLAEPLAPGEVGEPLMPPGLVAGLDRVVDDDELLVPVSRPSVASRSEQAAIPRVATAAAIATPIARAFICFIGHS
jgi:hypothetical protein